MNAEHEIDLVELWWIIWDRKYLVAATTVIFTALALFYAFTATPIFRASVIVTQVHDTTGLGGGSELGGSVGGLASLAGIDLGADSADLERQAIMQSRHLIEEFVQRKDVLPLLRANAKGAAAGTVWKLVERFRRTVLDIQEDKIKGTMTITMDWADPAVAARWANEFVALANELVRNKAIADASRSVDYLNQQIEHTNSVDVQRVMYNLIEAQTKTLMLANGRIEYAFTIVDPAVTPEVRVRPWRSLMAATGVVLGFLFGSLFAWVRVRFARQPRLPQQEQAASRL
jgi:uncharacterized protein involved in exopolysaccharide biosynthesis